MTLMNILQVVMWIVSVVLIPILAYLFVRVRDLELKMETRISHQDAAKMIKSSTDKFDARFDRLESLIIEDFKQRRN